MRFIVLSITIAAFVGCAKISNPDGEQPPEKAAAIEIPAPGHGARITYDRVTNELTLENAANRVIWFHGEIQLVEGAVPYPSADYERLTPEGWAKIYDDGLCGTEAWYFPLQPGDRVYIGQFEGVEISFREAGEVARTYYDKLDTYPARVGVAVADREGGKWETVYSEVIVPVAR